MLECQGIGNLTQDVELRYTSSGVAVAKINIAFNSKYGEKTSVNFMEAIIWGKSAEVANQYLKKGSKIYIKGEIKQEKWTGKDGIKKYKHIINVRGFEMLDCKKEQETKEAEYKVEYRQAPIDKTKASTDKPELPEIDIDEDEIPF